MVVRLVGSEIGWISYVTWVGMWRGCMGNNRLAVDLKLCTWGAWMRWTSLFLDLGRICEGETVGLSWCTCGYLTWGRVPGLSYLLSGAETPIGGAKTGGARTLVVLTTGTWVI